MRIVGVWLAATAFGLAACGGGPSESESSSGVSASSGANFPVEEARAVALEIARRAQERLSETKSHGANGQTFSARDLPSLLQGPPHALGEQLRRDGPISLSQSVAQVWAHSDVSRADAARWGRYLRKAGFQRAGRADFEPADGRFTVVVDAIVLADAASARTGVNVLQGVHSEHVLNNGLTSSAVPALGLGAPAWGYHSVGIPGNAAPVDVDLVAAFGFRVGNVSFSVELWG